MNLVDAAKISGLTPAESSFILDSFESLKSPQLDSLMDSLFFPVFKDVVIAVHEAEVVDKHRLLGKFAVSLLQLVDSE